MEIRVLNNLYLFFVLVAKINVFGNTFLIYIWFICAQIQIGLAGMSEHKDTKLPIIAF